MARCGNYNYNFFLSEATLRELRILNKFVETHQIVGVLDTFINLKADSSMRKFLIQIFRMKRQQDMKIVNINFRQE